MNAKPALKVKKGALTEKRKTSLKSRAGELKVLPGGGSKDEVLSQERRDALVVEHRIKARKLSRSILRKWQARLDIEEVDSVVDLSLCEAVKRFDPEKGASFITFLYYHLKGNLVRAVSSAANQNSVAVTAEEAELTGSTERRPINSIEISEALSSHEQVLPDEALLKKELIELSREACGRLDALEREVIEKIYIKGQQLIDIASELGYSRCHISRLKRRALETLHKDLSSVLEKNGKRALPEGVSIKHLVTSSKRRSLKPSMRRKQAKSSTRGSEMDQYKIAVG